MQTGRMTQLIAFVKESRKALLAAFGLLLTALYQAADGGLTLKEWLAALLAMAIGSGLVYVTPNQPVPLGAPGRARGAGGHSTVVVIVATLGLVFAALGATDLLFGLLLGGPTRLVTDVLSILGGGLVFAVAFSGFPQTEVRTATPPRGGPPRPQ